MFLYSPLPLEHDYQHSSTLYLPRKLWSVYFALNISAVKFASSSLCPGDGKIPYVLANTSIVFPFELAMDVVSSDDSEKAKKG